MATVHCSIHRLPLQLETVRDSFKCNSCKVMSFEERYKCPHEDCDYCIHEVCKDPPPNIQHSFFEDIVFDFKDTIVGLGCYCDACGLDIEGCSYRSSCSSGSRCSFYGTRRCHGHDLHTHCARTLLSNTEIATDGVRLLLKKKLSAGCGFCREITARSVRDGKALKSWGYVSEDGRYQFHIYCIKKTLINNWEMLTLRDESALLQYRMSRPQIETRNGNNRQGRGSSTSITRTLKVGVSLMVSMLLGNPSPLIIEAAYEFIVNN